MTTRDLTLQFTKLRDMKRTQSRLERVGRGSKIKMRVLGKKKKQAEQDRENLLQDDPEASVGLNSSTPSWVRVVDGVHSDIDEITSRIGDLGKLHGRHLKDAFSEHSGVHDDIHASTQQIRDLFHRCEVSIKQLSSEDMTGNDKVCRNVQQSLATDLHRLSSAFRKEQTRYLNKLRGREKASQGYVPDVRRADAAFSKHEGFNEMQMASLESSEEFVAQRTKDIQDVMDSVSELQSVFKELAVLVIDQGTIVDRIDYNMESVAATTTEAVKELVVADRRQRKGGVMVCIIALAVCVGIMTVLLFLKIIGKFNP